MIAESIATRSTLNLDAMNTRDRIRETSGEKPFDITDLLCGNQVLWPDHYMQGTEGAALRKLLGIPLVQLGIRKGLRTPVNGYPAFL